MNSSELWQQWLGAALAPPNAEGNRTSLEMAVVRSFDRQLAGRDRDRLARHRGELMVACGLDVVPVTTADSVTDLRHYVIELIGNPRAKKDGPVAEIRGLEPVNIKITGGRIVEKGTIVVADGRVLPRGAQCQLVFAGPDDQAYLIVPATRAPRRINPGPPVKALYRADYGGRDSVGRAMRAVQRADFMTPETRDLAKLDRAVDIGHGQTITQPSLVAWMLRLLDIQPGDRVLEVGSGSGYVLALASTLAAAGGSVVGCEVVPELLHASRASVKPYRVVPITIVPAYPGGALGAYDFGPFRRIIVSAAADCVPVELVKQLAPGGRLVVPVSSVLAVITKTHGGEVQEQYLTEPGVGFVPLV